MSTLFGLLGIGVPILAVAVAVCCVRMGHTADEAMEREWAHVQKEAEQERIRQAFLNSPARRRAK